MSWIAFLLGLILTLAGGASLFASIDLLTTEVGLLYATCGSIALSCGFVVLAIGLLIRRIDAFRVVFLHRSDARAQDRAEPILPPLVAGIEPVIVPEPVAVGAAQVEDADLSPTTAPEPSAMADGAEDRDASPISQQNRKGHVSAPETPERVAAERTPPTLVGRYGAGGANYSIFSDGSIEAQTDQGAFKFASMSDFKAFIAAKRS